jgi:hypothetical protein
MRHRPRKLPMPLEPMLASVASGYSLTDPEGPGEEGEPSGGHGAASGASALRESQS